jgi:O-succinylbenzoate synthase
MTAAPVHISRIDLLLVELPLARPFRTSFGTEHHRRAILVRVVTPELEGWGECVADIEPLYSSEFNDAAWIALERLFAPALLAHGPLAAREVAPILACFKGHRMAKAALELAVLDAEQKAIGHSLQRFFGGSGEHVVPGVSVGITDTVDELCAIVASHRDEGYRRIKLKIEPGWDLEPVARVRELLGPGFDLQVDANAAYSRSDFRHLSALDAHELLLIEQPLSEEDLLGHVAMAARIKTPICLDETIVSAEVARQAIELGACSVVNIKAGRVGGYLEAVRVHDLCQASGVPVWCGGMLETGIGRAANLALATLPGFCLPGDISASSRYFEEDVTDPFVLEDGKIAVPTGPGIGVTVNAEVVERLTRRRSTIQ